MPCPQVRTSVLVAPFAMHVLWHWQDNHPANAEKLMSNTVNFDFSFYVSMFFLSVNLEDPTFYATQLPLNYINIVDELLCNLSNETWVYNG